MSIAKRYRFLLFCCRTGPKPFHLRNGTGSLLLVHRRFNVPRVTWNVYRETHSSLCRRSIMPTSMGEMVSGTSATHQDNRYRRYILKGLKDSFQIRFNPSQCLVSTSKNLRVHEASIVSDYLTREVASNRTWKCPQSHVPKGINISPLGIIPKKNKP